MDQLKSQDVDKQRSGALGASAAMLADQMVEPMVSELNTSWALEIVLKWLWRTLPVLRTDVDMSNQTKKDIGLFVRVFASLLTKGPRPFRQVQTSGCLACWSNTGPAL